MSDLVDVSSLESSFKAAQEYNDASLKVIVDLQKKIEKLEAENKSLKGMLESNLPSLEFKQEQVLGISNEQIICEIQIKILKDEAVVGSLTLEQAKKLEIYTKILENIKSKKSPIAVDASITDAELINLVKI